MKNLISTYFELNGDSRKNSPLLPKLRFIFAQTFVMYTSYYVGLKEDSSKTFRSLPLNLKSLKKTIHGTSGPFVSLAAAAPCETEVECYK